MNILSEFNTTPQDTPTRTAPVVTAAVITSAVTALLSLLVAFGVPLSEAQQTSILGIFAVVGPIIVGYVGNGTTVEYRNGSRVYRGVANEGQTGEYVRPLSDEPPVLVDASDM